MLIKKPQAKSWVVAAMAWSLVVAGFGLAALGLAGNNLPPPKFRLTAGGTAIAPVKYPFWRRLSDQIAGRKYIMLTVDDGPRGHGVDERILAILARHGAHAVFFEVCANITSPVQKTQHEITDGGNIIANHSYDHLHLTQLRPSPLQNEIEGCSSRLEAVTGRRPAFFRPPWGQTSPAVLNAAHAAGMEQVLWDTNSGDTWLKDPQKIVQLSLDQASQGGSILLMHSRPTTADALDELLTQLQLRGFRFVLPEANNKPIWLAQNHRTLRWHFRMPSPAQTSPASRGLRRA
ncbi:MAG: polysaccharide deacetylase family protein [Proteobacteria bacterium]|nr:polysaccharide deacetylase family protein [Pseudomonadota bacterium]